MTTDELDAWQNDVPVVDHGDPDFNAWQYGVPVVDNPIDDNNIAGVGRRRAFIF